MVNRKKKATTQLGKQPLVTASFSIRTRICGGQGVRNATTKCISESCRLSSMSIPCRCSLSTRRAAIAHQDDMEHFLAAFFGEQKPEVIGNDYLALGTLDKPAWKQGTQQQMTLQEMLEALHDFKEVVTFKLTGGWVRDGRNLPKILE